MFANASPLQTWFQSLKKKSKQTNMCLSVTFATAMLIRFRPTPRAVCRRLFRSGLCQRITGRTVDTFPDSECRRRLWAEHRPRRGVGPAPVENMTEPYGGRTDGRPAACTVHLGLRTADSHSTETEAVLMFSIIYLFCLHRQRSGFPPTCCCNNVETCLVKTLHPQRVKVP